jgi:dihydroflavonol-4-reductase
MGKVLVTGATGLIGSVIAERLRRRGDEVVALVRQGTDASALARLGVEIARGDVTDRASIDSAIVGCDGVIHSAAIVGLPQQEFASSRAVNVGGTVEVLDAARSAGVTRAAVLSTAAVFDRATAFTERSHLSPNPPSDPYTQTKTEAYHEIMRRVAGGQHVALVLPGATFGPSPMGERVINIPGGNQRLARALRGEAASYPPMTAPWSHTAHVAEVSIAALDHGDSGALYIAFGAPDCVTTIAAFVNRACELAGVDHRVDAVTIEQLDDPEVAAKFGPTLVTMAKLPSPQPFFDATATHRFLGIQPQSFDATLIDTIDWLRTSKLV